MKHLNLIYALTGLQAGIVLATCIHVATAISNSAPCTSTSAMRQLSPHERPIAPLPALAPAVSQIGERYWL
ncbi:hypothetical protein [Pseudomonas syringae]|nr:hypothetical protein [Pseudomonas syringae]